MSSRHVGVHEVGRPAQPPAGQGAGFGGGRRRAGRISAQQVEREGAGEHVGEQAGARCRAGLGLGHQQASEPRERLVEGGQALDELDPAGIEAEGVGRHLRDDLRREIHGEEVRLPAERAGDWHAGRHDVGQSLARPPAVATPFTRALDQDGPCQVQGHPVKAGGAEPDVEVRDLEAVQRHVAPLAVVARQDRRTNLGAREIRRGGSIRWIDQAVPSITDSPARLRRSRAHTEPSEAPFG